MSRHNRWSYLGTDLHNPPNNDCPECTEPSKTWHQGAKTVDGVTTRRYKCEHLHMWQVTEPAKDG